MPHRTLWPKPDYTAADIREIRDFLRERGTFRFPSLPNGLFSAAVATHDDFAATGYQAAWLRDNIHIAHAHLVCGQPAVAVRCIDALANFYVKYQAKFDDIFAGRADPADPMRRPQIRFDGTTLSEIDQKWSHAQNDALGYFVWLSCRLMAENRWQPNAGQIQTLANVVHFWDRVRFWQDEDSGHWEETRKVAASSVGVATAALRDLATLLREPKWREAFAAGPRPLLPGTVHRLRDEGHRTLREILPAECVQPDPAQARRYDAALLFLIFPVEIADNNQSDQILHDVKTVLQGPHGIRRYPGDSYWCADYKTALAAEERTADFSDDISARDALLKPGLEAQWCIFDPIVSVIHGKRYQQSGALEERRQQVAHFNRSLSQLTPADSRFGPYRCPESYYCERGTYVPNDITPLLWTQANLWLALELMEVGGSRGS